MACFYPVPAFRTAAGNVVMVERGDISGDLVVPCGNCVGCRLERARQWSIRIMHEASMHEANCFVTLTYSDEKVPEGGSLRYSDFILFIRALRRAFKGVSIRYYMCGEYGEHTSRPHYHACLFGVDFRSDRVVYSRGGSGMVLYRSATLERLWPHGISSIGELTRESAGYVARYVMKKVTGDLALEHYGDREPEFNHMSTRPGIGAKWFEKYRSDVYPHDRVVVKGRAVRPPRYYDRLLRRVDAELYKDIKSDREAAQGLQRDDNTPRRLAVKEQVTLARVSRLHREFEE